MATNTADILKLLSDTRFFNTSRQTSVVFSNGSSITFNENRSTNLLEIDGHRYSLDDPNAVVNMPQSTRETFWSICSDKAKDSELYRSYARAILVKNNISLDRFNSEKVKLAIINNASDFAKLISSCKQHGHADALQDLQDWEEDQLVTLVKKASNIKELVKIFNQLGYKSPLTTLKNIEPTYLNTLLENAYNAGECLKGLIKIGYQDALPLLLSIEASKLTDLLNNYYNSLEVIKGFAKLGYQNAFTKFIALTPEQNNVLVNNHYNCFEVMKSLLKLGHRDPFVTFFSIDPQNRQLIIDNHYSSFELINFFQKIKYLNPLQTFLDLDPTTRHLYLDNTYAAKEIMLALYKQGKNDPLSYLKKLGNDAFITMANSQYEYTSRIQRGVNLELEFLPAVLVNNEFSPALKSFINILDKQESNTSLLAALNIDNKQLEQFRDSYNHKIVNKPVRVDGDLFDLDTLTNLKVDKEGYRTNPLTQEKFLLSDLQPAKDVQRKLSEIIENAQVEKARNQSSFTL
ncbi:hypothetical protein A8135_09235 [Legionella jamestowniensis]|uniref:Ankyrin repeat-containing protein n=1 Tax=Legionella jamestowniensis TaxID=455 RepID=A0ABX2XXJ3_9GAMM|nr:hypothetical protein [Legionella jamestowniensis]OCH98936.1 hypothetical protein A8135_09235 [Legionella jamestowniensis]